MEQIESKATADDREAQLATTFLPDGRSWLVVARNHMRIAGARERDVLAFRRFSTATRARDHAWAQLVSLGYSYLEIAEGWCCNHTSVIEGVRRADPAIAAARAAKYGRRPGLTKAQRYAAQKQLELRVAAC